MGRKKRKTVVEEAEEVAPPSSEDQPVIPTDDSLADNTPTTKTEEEDDDDKKSSKYAMQSHSGDIHREDIYISDGSEDEEEDVDVVLAGSRSGMMRRGLATPMSMMIQPNRQWVKPDAAATGDATQDTSEEDAEAKRAEELAALDPVQRAARLQAEKLRLEEQEQELARLTEAQENAGRDPTLFSKRTAFDIRFDQMEDKPWLRATDISDFFNYELDEEGWLAYAQQQMTIRQELVDANRMKRTPDPTIVPVTPKAPKAQGDRVAITGTTDGSASDNGDEAVVGEGETAGATTTEVAGPALPQTCLPVSKKAEAQATENTEDDTAESSGVGGAWAVPEAALARLMQEQEQEENGGGYDKSYREDDRAEQNLPQSSSYSDDRHYNDDYKNDQEQQTQRYRGRYGGEEGSGQYESYSGGRSQEGHYSSHQQQSQSASDYGGGYHDSNYGNDRYSSNDHYQEQDDGYGRSRERGQGGRSGRGWDKNNNSGGDHYNRKRQREWRR